MTQLAGSHPILTCADARALEDRLFASDEAKEWSAMQGAGRALAEAVLRDFGEIGGFPAEGRILVLAGKGHNGGDALIAAHAILEKHPHATAEVAFVFGRRLLRPLAARAWRDLQHAAGERVHGRPGLAAASQKGSGERSGNRYDLCLDGIFGFQFRTPAGPAVVALIERVNTLPIRMRAAVDLPSAGKFRADFTYATGSVKAPVVGAPEAGRVRYLNLGFFDGSEPASDRVLTPALLRTLAAWRPAISDKRTFGHLFAIGGSRGFPGAILMSVLAALRSGAGLVTAFVPESLAPAFAARAPEAMWVGCPETAGGGLASASRNLILKRIGRASAFIIGPGMGRDPETLELAAGVVRESTVPLVIDADALQPEIVRAGRGKRIVTPHAGEFARIGGGMPASQFAGDTGATVVLKGPVTRIFDGGERTVYHSFFGGPVLARGGSGDILAGLIGGLLAQTPGDPLLAAARGAVWHGMTADALARAHGEVAVSVTQLLDFLPVPLRELRRGT
ncbi:MAG: NAD(P)H-hydrate dehydratase [Opitutus sp.]